MLNIQNLKLDNLKLRARILLGYSIPITILVGLNGLIYFGNQRTTEVLKDNVRTQDVFASVNELRYSLNRSDRAFRGYLVNLQEASLKSYQAGLKEYREAITQAEKLSLTPEERQKLQQLKAVGNELINFSEAIIVQIRNGNMTGALNAFKTRKGVEMIRRFDALAGDLLDEEGKLLAQTNQEAKETLALSSLIYTLATLVSIIVSLVGGLVIASGIAKTLKEAASQVTDSSSLIANTVTQQERIVVEQADSVNQTSSTMDQLGLVSLQSAIQAEASAEGAQKALNIAEDGAKAIEQTMTTMGNLKERVQAIAQQIMTLSEQTAQINRVSNLVGDLANQTNMLALNAAVEAARAGDQGKGFGVVASEIRKLADESKKSAEKINNLVNDIQSSMNSTVMVTDEGTKTAEESIKLAQESVQAFLGVTEAINLVFDNSRDIEQSAKQQAIAVQEVVASINALNLGAQETTDGIANVKTSTEKLNSAARQLEAVV